MFMISQSVDINRMLTILLSEYIYQNKTKLSLLSTCKFMYKLKYDILYYEEIYVTNKTNIKYLNSLTNIRLTSLNGLKMFNNLISVKIIIDDQNSITIDYVPPRLKKLEILSSKIIIRAKLSNVTHLKLCGLVDLNFIFNELPTGLKCLILGNEFNNLLKKYVDIKMLPMSIEHFGLYTNDSFDINILEKIIPKNIKYFESNNYNFFNIACHYPTLTKINFNPGYAKTSTFVNYASLFKIYIFLFSIGKLKYLKMLHIERYISLMQLHIPNTVSKLKINYIQTDQILPTGVEELIIKNIVSVNNNLLFIGHHVKKLTIRHKDQHLLDPNIKLMCAINYLY